MTITARALGITQQTDSFVEQMVRFFNNGNPVKDAPVQYAPGPDQVTARANLTRAVKAAIARQAADGSTVAVAPGTMLDLSDPVVTPPTPPTQDEIDYAAYFAAKARVETLRGLLADKRAEITQAMLDSAIADWNALRFDLAWEGVGVKS